METMLMAPTRRLFAHRVLRRRSSASRSHVLSLGLPLALPCCYSFSLGKLRQQKNFGDGGIVSEIVQRTNANAARKQSV